jgi:hypothetical protein
MICRDRAGPLRLTIFGGLWYLRPLKALKEEVGVGKPTGRGGRDWKPSR